MDGYNYRTRRVCPRKQLKLKALEGMKMKQMIGICVVIMLLVVSCSEAELEYEVSGNLLQSDMPISDAAVSLYKHEAFVQETITDDEGKFRFTGISEGNYNLVYSATFEDGRVSGDVRSINLDADVSFENLLLPDPISLLDPLEVTWTSVTLNWSQFNSEGFYEYKVYKAFSPALDETTGELIYISTSVSDTSFYDLVGFDEIPGNDETYYYRVYVYNRYGLMSGSNILEVTTDKWEDESNFIQHYQLNQVSNFSLPGGGILTGIDYDGQYLWILSLVEVGGYYDPNTIRLTKYDYEQGGIIDTFEYHEVTTSPSLAWDGNYLWINYMDTGGHNNKIQKVDPITGSVLATHKPLYGLQDISSDGTSLFLSYYYNLIEKVSVDNFSLVETYANPFGSGANFGIAHRDGEIWLSCKTDRQLAILDEQGVHIGVADTELLSEWNGYNSHLHICFMDEKLVLIKNSRVYILEIE